jgi:hypothetical protein
VAVAEVDGAVRGDGGAGSVDGEGTVAPSLQRRHELAVAWAACEARNYGGVTPVDVDPETYVREEEQIVTPDGSLSVGSLKGC